VGGGGAELPIKQTMRTNKCVGRGPRKRENEKGNETKKEGKDWSGQA